LEGLGMDIDIFLGHLAYLIAILVYYVVIWYIFPVFGMFSKKNMATLALEVWRSGHSYV
jgi:hypothetical protein